MVGPVHAAFLSAYETFLQGLPLEQRASYAPCASADDLLAGIQKLDILSQRRKKQWSGRLTRSIKTLLDRLQAYFNIVDVAIQCDPQYSAIVWGAVRFVLMLVSEYASFFERLVSMLERLANTLPTLERIPAEIASSDHIRDLLEKIYTNILKVFQVTALVFMNGKGRVRKTPAIIGNCLWTPFDVRYKGILEDLQIQKDILFDEIILLQAQRASYAEFEAAKERKQAAVERLLAKNARERLDQAYSSSSETLAILQEQAKAATMIRVREWLSSPDYISVFHRCRTAKEDGTNIWIFEETVFRQWCDATWVVRPPVNRALFGTNALWLHGSPGVGKSVLASTIIQQLDKPQSQPCRDQEIPLVLYFFFQAGDISRNVELMAWRSILSQVLDHCMGDANLIDLFLFAMEESTTLKVADVYFNLLQSCLDLLPGIYMVLDGIDECEDHGALIARLRSLSSSASVKLLLVSRSNLAPLQRSRGKPTSILMHRDRVGRDIELYATSHLQDLLDDGLLPETEEITELVEKIRKGSNGMFLWAVLMCRYLRSPALTPARRARTLRQVVLPEGLEMMYDRILSLICASGETERSLACQILLWISYAQGSLNETLAEQAILHYQGDDPEEPSDRFEGFTEAVVVVCAGLVEAKPVLTDEITDESPSRTLTFTHLSIQEYINRVLSNSDLAERFPGLLMPCHIQLIELTGQLLDVILRSTPPISANFRHCRGVLEGRLGRFPLLTFACWAWINTLAKMHNYENQVLSQIPTDKIRALASKINAFLDKPEVVTYWLEVIYTSGPCQPATLATLLPENRRSMFQLLGHWAQWILELRCKSLSSLLSGTASRLLELQKDIIKFTDEWHGSLVEDPSLLYDEVVALTKSAFLLQPSYGDLHVLSAERPGIQGLSSQPLCTSSSNDSSGDFSVVLTIWTSKDFEDYWEQLDPINSYAEVERFCVGWRAQVEVWSTTAQPRRTAALDVLLDESEVALQLRQSFRMDAGHEWKTSFPSAIHAESKSIIILRTVYRLCLGSDPRSPPSLQSVTLPMDCHPDLRSKWTDELPKFDPKNVHIAKVPPSLHFIHRDWYPYSLVFNLDGDSVLFADYHFFHTCHLVIFALHETTDSGLQAAVVTNDVMVHDDSRRRPPKGMVFCKPTVVAFYFPEALWFWHFAESADPYCERLLAGATNLTVSLCGNYIVVDTEEGNVVVPIPMKAPDQRTVFDLEELPALCVPQVQHSRPPSEFVKTNKAIQAETTEPRSPTRELESGPNVNARSQTKILEYQPFTGDHFSNPRSRLAGEYDIAEQWSPVVDEMLGPEAHYASQDRDRDGVQLERGRKPVDIRHVLQDNAGGELSRPVSIIEYGRSSTVSMQSRRRTHGSDIVDTYKLLQLPRTFHQQETTAFLKLRDEDDAKIRVFVNKRAREDNGFGRDFTDQAQPFIIDRTICDLVVEQKMTKIDSENSRNNALIGQEQSEAEDDATRITQTKVAARRAVGESSSIEADMVISSHRQYDEQMSKRLRLDLD